MRKAFSQAIDSTLWVTDGRVSAIASAGPTLYIGGQFTSVGPASGGCAFVTYALFARPRAFSKYIGASGGLYFGKPKKRR